VKHTNDDKTVIATPIMTMFGDAPGLDLGSFSGAARVAAIRQS